MNHDFGKKLAAGVTASLLACCAFAAATTPNPAGESQSAEPKRARSAAIANWSAPQFLNMQSGIASNLAGFKNPGVTAKAALELSTFIPITPCRLVDTRGVFSPVYAGGPFAAGEVRVYRTSGNCGVPAGNDRVIAVSLAVTTPPTVASGDIEVVSESQALGNTVVMVIQAGQWNSATTVSAADAQGDIKVQLRGTGGHVVIDINGYYASVNDTIANGDYFSIIGTYSLGGGLLYIVNNSFDGAAINANNAIGDGHAYLAYGDNAVLIAGGTVGVSGAGVQSAGRTAMVHKVNTSGSYTNGTTPGTLCPGFPAFSVINNVYANNNPDAILLVTPVEQYSYGTANQTAFGAYHVAAYYAPPNICSSDGIGHWAIHRTDNAAHLNGMGYAILVIVPQ